MNNNFGSARGEKISKPLACARNSKGGHLTSDIANADWFFQDLKNALCYIANNHD